MNSELKAQLTQQLKYLQTSARLYDEGDTSEAIRIAIILRVLLHQTEKSHALLLQMGLERINLLSTSPPAPTLTPTSTVFFNGGLSISRIEVGNGKASAKFIPQFDEFPFQHHWISPDEWWNETIHILASKPIGRRTIALGASNNEGAHIDLNFKAGYKEIREGVFLFQGQTHEGPFSFNVTGQHLADLRQMAHEILNSPQLIAAGDNL